MANYQLTYVLSDDTTERTINLLPGDDGVRVEWQTEINRNIGSTGIIENVVQRTLRYITFDCYFRESEFHKLETWMAYAQQGRPFSFTKDADNHSVATAALSADASIDDTSIAVDTDLQASLTDGDYIYLSDLYGTKWDILKTTAVGASTITLTDYPTHAYTTTDSVICWYYSFPNLYLMDDSFDPDRNGEFWHHTFNCVEVRNAS